MGEIVNPYIAGAPVTEQRMFFGREDVFSWIQNSLTGQYADHILVIHGQRRVGKTSVLKQLGNRLPQKYMPVFFDLQGRTHTTLDRFLWGLAREIVRVLKQDRSVDFPLPDKQAFATDIEYFEHRFLADLKPVLGNTTLLLTFDEFDNLEESEVKEELARPLINYLRRLIDNGEVNFIFSIGSSGRKLENMQAAYTEFFKTALYKKISFLDEEQTRKLIARPVENIIEYDARAITRIFQIAGGHPYFTQLTCHELFAKCQQTNARNIKEVDVESVLDDIVERGTVNLKFVWDEASDIEKWILAALAQLDKADNRALADFLLKQRVRFSESNLTSGLLRLREKDVLTSDNRFVIYLLKLWLQKNRPIDQVREELTEVNPIANRYIEIGMEFKDAGVYDKAIESFQEALDIAKDNIQAQVNIALTYMDQKVYDKAVIEFEKALKIDSEDVSARSGLCESHLALGDVAMQKNRPKDAILSYQRVLAINTEHTEARGRMAEIARQRAEKALNDGRDEEALSIFTDALRYTPEDISLNARVEEVKAERKARVLAAQIARSEKEANLGNWEKALAALHEALQIAPEDESILKKIADLKERQLQGRLNAILIKAEQAEKSNKWDTAIATLNEYLSLNEDRHIQKRLADLIAAKHAAWMKAILVRVEQSVANQKWDEAFNALNEVLTLEPGNVEIQKKMDEVRDAQRVAKLNTALKQAEQAKQAGKWDEAIDSLNNAITLSPEDETLKGRLKQVMDAKRVARLQAALRLAETAAQSEKWDTAFDSLNEILTIEPNNEEFRNKLKDLQARRRESELNALRTQAQTMMRAERFDEALSAWNEYLAMNPDDGEKARAEIDSVKEVQVLAKSYVDAQKAYTKRNYDKAIVLFKEIVEKNYDYKNASQMLAEAVELRRTARKWWQSKWLWGVVFSSVVLIVGWFAFRPGSPLMSALFAPTTAPTSIPVPIVVPATPAFTFTPTVTPTPLPLSWARLNSGQFLPRATISSIVFDTTDPGVMYAGTSGAGIYKSIDGGLSWQPVHNGLGRSDVSSLIMDSKDSKTLYAGMVLGGVYKTTDGGQMWHAINEGIGIPGGAFLATVAMDPTDPDHLYYTDSLGLYETKNAGESWTKLQMSVCPKIITSMVIPPGATNTIYVADRERSDDCDLGIHRSRDGGVTWDFIPIEINTSLQLRYLSLAVVSEPQESIYISAGNAGEERLYRTMDKGKAWESILDHGCYAIYFDPDQSGRTYCGGPNQLLMSQDWGDSWTPIMRDKLIWEVTASPHSKGVMFAGGAGSGLFISTDGGATWSERNSGLGGAYASLTIHPFDSTALFAEVGNNIYRSANGGQGWNLLTSRGSGLAFDADKKTMYILADAILKSEDEGGNWEAMATTNQDISSFVANPQQSDMLIAVHDSGFSLSYDGGKTWDETNNVVWAAETSKIIGTIFTLLFPDKAGNQFYILINSETIGMILHLDGSTGVQQVCKLPNNLTTINLLAIDPRNSSWLIISSPGNGLVTSRDGCQSWLPSNTGLGSLFVNTVVIDPNHPDTLYAGTDGGAYVSYDNGQTWGQINDGLLGATVVYSIVVDKDSNVYAATPYGIFKLEGK